jgi:hypothetical protein
MAHAYLIETTEQSPLALGNFTPKRKVAFIIQGSGATLSPSFEMMAACLVQRGYDDLIAVRDTPHVFCRERRNLARENIAALFEDLARQLSPDDVLFTAVLGASHTRTGMVYLDIPRSSSALSAIELRDLLSQIPVQHAVSYISPDTSAGEFARYVAQASHPDLGNRHIAIAPTVPSVFASSYSHCIKTGRYQTSEVVTPFHAGFFDPDDKPSLEARFHDAALYQQESKRPDACAYMRYGAIHPREIAFRPATR